MDRRFRLSLLAGLAMLAACDKFEKTGPEPLLTEITVGQEGAVKTSLSGTSVLWSAGDQLAVFADGNSVGNKFTLQSGEGTGSGTFSGVRPQYVSTENYFITYPATATYNGNSTFTFTLPSEVEYTAGTFAPGSNPMLSGTSSTFGNFTMKNLCGVLKLRLKGSIKVSRLELTFDKAVTGPGTVSRGGNTLAMTGSADSYKTVAVNCSSAQQLNTSTAKEFIVVIPDGSYSSLTLNAVLADGSISSKSLTEPFTITRSAQTTMETTMPSARASLQVWSFNVACQSNDDNSDWSSSHYWSVRRPGIYAFFNDNEPDIIGTQECEYRQRVNILDNTEGYAAYGLGVEYGKESSGSTGYLWNKKDYNTDSSNAIFYRTARFDVLDKGTFWLSSNPSSVGSGGGRNCAWIKFRIKATGEVFYVFNTHFEAHYTAEAYATRKAEAEILYNQIEAINTGHLPVIVTGDFNESASDMMGEEKGYTGWGDYYFARNVDGKTSKTAYPVSYNNFTEGCAGFSSIYGSGTVSGGGSNLDHIIYRYCYEDAKHGLVPGSFGTDFRPYAGVTYISDHWPVTATLIFDYQ